MAEIGPNLQQGGYFNGPAPQSGRYDTQVNPEGADRPTINPHSIHIDSSVGDALSGVGREGAAIAERQLAAEQRLWLTQQTAADDLAAQKMEIDARNSVEPGGTTFKGVNEGWQQYTQSRLESIKDPILKSVYASSLTQAGKSLMGSAQTFDAQEQQRQAGVNFQQAVENKSKFYDNLNPSLVDARLQNDLGELGSVIDKTAATPEERQAADDLVQLLTPVVKAMGTDTGFDVANLGVQIFGGHGYIREHGMEQYVRDARITQIYEGTNGIQALDLVGRKMGQHYGRYLRAFFHPVQDFIEANATDPAMEEMVLGLAKAFGRLQQAVGYTAQKGMSNPNEAGAAASDLLRMFAYVAIGFMWARAAKIALGKGNDDPTGFYASKLKTAKFYMARVMPQTGALLSQILAGGDTIMDIEDKLFDAA